jgi:hypothetical protein
MFVLASLVDPIRIAVACLQRLRPPGRVVAGSHPYPSFGAMTCRGQDVRGLGRLPVLPTAPRPGGSSMRKEARSVLLAFLPALVLATVIPSRSGAG